MVKNYIILYDPPSNNEESYIKSDQLIKEYAKEINESKTYIKRKFVIKLEKLYKNIEKLDDKFYSDDKCNSCGTCEDICPVNNIKLVDGKPKWNN